jgi:hypothetical protein
MHILYLILLFVFAAPTYAYEYHGGVEPWQNTARRP